jgi:two-component system, cell cycle response regulator
MSAAVMAESSVVVLLVNTGSPQAEALLRALVAKGYVCSRAGTASEAIQLTMDTVFDVAIVEKQLPGESGLAVVSHLRGDERQIPILFLVDGEDVTSRVEALRAGADDVISTPAHLDEVFARLERRLILASTVSALRAERDALKALSTTDGLTQVANHRAFHERLTEEFRRAQRYDDPIALIAVDVDHFKRVNDNYGHQVGDTVLVEVARAIGTAVRETDFLARSGGEEFAVLLPKTHLAGALSVAERMSQAISAARAGPDGNIRVTASFGVSGFPGRGVTTAEQLFKTADDALFRSKREGRNKISLFQSSLFVARN